MTRTESLFLSISNALVAGTGFVYAWMAYFAVSEDPDALVNHPLQPDVQHAHVIVAPLLVFALGLVWSAHVWPRVRNGHRARRWTGLALFGLCAPMVASGYLLQTASSAGWRTIWVWIHVATSVLWTAAFVAHRFGLRARREAAATSAADRGSASPSSRSPSRAPRASRASS
ncbi:MAG: hypothetical protein NTY35_08815 [Planctomycetota bacterium]|nr:hypothetical protein [Planctomycetota bacterium]